MKFELNAQARTLQGSGASRRLRRANKVPGIIYGGSAAPEMVEIPHNDLLLALPFAQQLGAGDRTARVRDQRARRAGGDLGRKRVQRAPRRGLDPAMGELLDAVADPQL